ncbi:dihydroxyacetone kinase subunit DhaK [Jeotgalibacillus soli]|uniref:phosphoenolpyruvate--glycerone phosphotransferase n=1 Tax=Jeotgalibacillus soli TaxID=889306 RepID=A0A0C2VKG6_9BACL|nr:dihydroxyacetone kinase subunit DhaK [Jeotgalibacillus soli]KIL49392.1 dihydroxyacetone kinase subunit K [Jeotgalibacillus soli]
MKKLINHPSDVVLEMVQGIVAAYPNEVELLPDTTVIVRKQKTNGKVGIVSGGGSGHEPAHAGYVGKGMLDAAVAGEAFTSPGPDQVLEAIKAADSGAGVLLVIKNYSGDVMNFEMAAELAEAEGITVEKVIVNDDVAVEDSTYTTGRRGIAGTIFVHKIAGALAETGASLQEVHAAAEKVVQQVRSMGMALSPCIVPGNGKPSFVLGDNEMEMGMGIHGEPGLEREELKSADEVAEKLLQPILEEGVFKTGDHVAVMVNGLGATPLMELYIVNRKIQELLKEKGLHMTKTYVGNYMTAFEMAGCSLTLLRLDDQLYELLQAPCDAPGF